MAVLVGARMFQTLEDHAAQGHYLVSPAPRAHGRYLGTRKLRRLMNETFSDSVVDVDSVVDFGGDPLGLLHEKDGPLTALTRHDNARLLSAFLAFEQPLTEPAANALLGLPEGALARGAARAAGARSEPRFPELGGAAAMWRRVDRRLRAALRAQAGSSEVAQLESAARAFLGGIAAATSQHGGRPLVLRAEAPFERLLAHGVCQFYGMPATSTEMGGSRCVVASWRHGQERARLAAAISVTRTAAECARPLPNTVQEEEEEAGDGERGVGRP